MLSEAQSPPARGRLSSAVSRKFTWNIKMENRFCCMPYYRKDQYDLLRNASVDKDTFSISYNEMTRITDAKFNEFEKNGFKVVRIHVDVEELIAWCDFRGMTLNPESRTRFALDKFKETIRYRTRANVAY
jgi:hypothetical protein